MEHRVRVEQALLENADSVGRGYVVSFATPVMVLKRSAKAAVDIPGTTLLGRAHYERWAAAVDLVWLERAIRQRWLGCATCVRYGDGAPISHRVGNRPRLVHRRSVARPGTQSSTVSSHFHKLNVVGNPHPHGLHVAVGTGLRDMVSARSSLGSDRHGTSIRRKVASIFCSATFNRTVLVTKFRLSMEGCGLLLKHR